MFLHRLQEGRNMLLIEGILAPSEAALPLPHLASSQCQHSNTSALATTGRRSSELPWALDAEMAHSGGEGVGQRVGSVGTRHPPYTLERAIVLCTSVSHESDRIPGKRRIKYLDAHHGERINVARLRRAGVCMWLQ